MKATIKTTNELNTNCYKLQNPIGVEMTLGSMKLKAGADQSPNSFDFQKT